MCLKSEDAHRIELEGIDYQQDKGYFLDQCKSCYIGFYDMRGFRVQRYSFWQYLFISL